jgi:hypothetical protein
VNDVPLQTDPKGHGMQASFETVDLYPVCPQAEQPVPVKFNPKPISQISATLFIEIFHKSLKYPIKTFI